jgi:hypothetical protein
VKPSFTQSVSVLRVQVMRMFCCFDGFSDDVGKASQNIGYGFYSVEVWGEAASNWYVGH